MKHRAAALLAVVLVALAVAGSAFAFDCIRVSSSLAGLEASTQSGNWLLFDFSSAQGAQSTLENIGVVVTGDQAACLATEYAKSGEPLYFALGINVAGGEKGVGVLAWNNPNERVLQNGKGIDHLDDSGILVAANEAAATCGVDLGDS